jgi:hypothetical protein
MLESDIGRFPCPEPLASCSGAFLLLRPAALSIPASGGQLALDARISALIPGAEGVTAALELETACGSRYEVRVKWDTAPNAARGDRLKVGVDPERIEALPA